MYEMKAPRYSILLPVLHLFLAALLIYHQQERIWPYLRNTPPVDEPEIAKPIQMDIAWTPCYEYRPIVADHFVMSVEFPTGIAMGLDGTFRGCNPGVLAFLFRKLRMRAKNGTIFLDILLALGIAGQWWLIGWRIDACTKEQNRPGHGLFQPQ
jgi:hypothetical protein